MYIENKEQKNLAGLLVFIINIYAKDFLMKY